MKKIVLVMILATWCIFQHDNMFRMVFKLNSLRPGAETCHFEMKYDGNPLRFDIPKGRVFIMQPIKKELGPPAESEKAPSKKGGVRITKGSGDRMSPFLYILKS
jgi:hypothetical protein